MELPQPKNQKEEVLYMLFQYKKGLTDSAFSDLSFIRKESIDNIVMEINFRFGDIIHRTEIESQSGILRHYMLVFDKAKKQYLEMVKRK